MDHIRAVASWITTGVVTVGLALGLVSSNHGLGQPTKSAVSEARVTTVVTTPATTTVPAPAPSGSITATSSSNQVVHPRFVSAPSKPVTTSTEAPTTTTPPTTTVPTTIAPTTTYTSDGGDDGSYTGTATGTYIGDN